jgi:predicted alpha/beta-hydrolase family hydrolase
MIKRMKQERILLKTEHHQSEGILQIPDKSKDIGVILAHGAGGDMNSDFIRFFHEGISDAGYPCLKFNFPYSQNKKKVPDPQSVLMAIYRKAIEAIPSERVVIGGKSMGGRMASYVAGENQVAGLIFLGYPLHAPGKPDQLRDQHLYSIRKPMLFVSGTKDPFARKDLMESVLKKIGNYAHLYAIENGGHSFETSRKADTSRAQTLKSVEQEILKWLKNLE